MLELPNASDYEAAHTFKLFEKAREVRLNAYAPYSGYLVGVALLTIRGNVYVGCNVEAADFDGTHAEESALSAMVAAGERSPIALVVLGGLQTASASESVTPCGKCRQKLYEFDSLNSTDLHILTHDPQGELRALWLSRLLPSAFGPASIGVNLQTHRR